MLSELNGALELLLVPTLIMIRVQVFQIQRAIMPKRTLLDHAWESGGIEIREQLTKFGIRAFPLDISQSFQKSSFRPCLAIGSVEERKRCVAELEAVIRWMLDLVG